MEDAYSRSTEELFLSPKCLFSKYCAFFYVSPSFFFFFASYSNVPICAFQALAVLTLKATKELLNFCHAVLLSNMEGEEIP